jgi:cysteine desulfurase
MTGSPIYLDYNATTPIAPEVADAMLPFLRGGFGNPSSAHPYGREAHQSVGRAREQVAALLNASPTEIVFTSGGTESNNTVIKGVAEKYQERGKHIIVSAIEHPAVLEPCRWLATRGYSITILPVDDVGRVSIHDVANALTPNTILISIMLANNEVGTLQPIAEIAELAHRQGVLVQTDAAQAVGKIPVDVKALDADFVSVAGHKLYAPKGIGVLYIREGLSLPKFMHGASHESNRRAGTENVLEIVGLGAAAELARTTMDQTVNHLQAMRDRLWEHLSQQVDDLRRNGDPAHFLPNTLSVSIRGVEANTLLDHIGDRVAASAGAACHADQVEVSAVLKAMAVPLDFAMGTLRLTTGRLTTADEIDEAAQVIAGAVHELRA